MLNWSVDTSTLSGGNWLTVSPTSGTTDAGTLEAPSVEVSVSAAGLEPGEYYGQVQVTSQEAGNSPQVATIVLNVLPAGSNPGPRVGPTGMIFTGIAGGSDPAPQTVTLSNLTDSPKPFNSGRFIAIGGVDWFTHSPAVDGVVAPGQPFEVVIQPNIAGLSAGVRRGMLILAFRDGSFRVVDMFLVLAPEGSTTQRLPTIGQQDGCSPTALVAVFSLLGFQFNVTARWPVPVEILVVDDCGHPLTAGSVVVTFSNGDPPLALQSLQDGRWSGTWQTRNTATNEVSLTATARIPGTSILGTAQIMGEVQNNLDPPQVGNKAVVSAASFAPQVPAAPGSLISIFGVKMADATGAADAGDLHRSRDLRAAALELAETLLGKIAELVDELAAPLDEPVGHGTRRVADLDPTQHDVVLDLDLLLVLDRNDLIGRPLPLQVHPAAHHRVQGAGEALVADALADPHPLEHSLAEVVGQPAHVIHVTVAQGHAGRAEGDPRAHPDVEAHVQLGHLDDGLLAGDADALDAVWRDEEKTDLPRLGGLLG